MAKRNIMKNNINNNIDKTSYSCKQGNGASLGAVLCEEGLSFTCAYKVSETLILNIYDTAGECVCSVDMLKFKVGGNVYSVKIISDNYDAFYSYEYVLDGKVTSDLYEKNHENKRGYAEIKDKDNSERSIIYKNEFDWDGDDILRIPYDEIISYSMHVRGFTMHKSSKVKAKGTFRGITEKISYLKDLSINQIILMPCYEFYEMDSQKEKLLEGHPKYANDKSIDINGNVIDNIDDYKLNYWGFKKAHYFSPKAAYSYSDDFVREFKEMVKALHKAEIEVVMQVFFDREENPNDVLEILRFWRKEYHVDGFQVMGSEIPRKNIVSDNMLSDVKLYFEYVDIGEIEGLKNNKNEYIAEVSKAFLTDARRFLKSDDDSLDAFVRAQRYNPSTVHRINYLTCYEGFTLNDLVSYDYKHNEDNGEDNRDGTNYNYSWNCGVEGPSKKKAVQVLRLKQMKNAFCLLLLSQATPMLFMGDEFMNTQLGNNNPYCLDNEKTWLNWNLNKQNEQLLSFVKELISFRKSHKLLHLKNELKLMDYKSLGFPDASYHQDMAWKSRTDSFIKHIGIMLSGEYLDGEDSIYIAYNMHWENHLFGLPRLSKNMRWEYIFDTSDMYNKDIVESDLKNNSEEICVYGRSIMVLKANKK